MIVDSPGVGESNAMNEFALSYLPHAFCFIYVINSSNAGGIQEDRVRRPLLPFAKRLLLYTGTLKTLSLDVQANSCHHKGVQVEAVVGTLPVCHVDT